MDRKKLRCSALHEASHAALAAYFSWPIDWVKINQYREPHGETALRLPLQPWQLTVRYQEDPRRTRTKVVQVVGVISAPGVVLNTVTTGSDLEALEQWRDAWNAARSPSDWSWRFICTDATLTVRRWLATRGRREDLERLAGLLMVERRISGTDWHDLMDYIEEQREIQTYRPENVFLCSRSSWRDHASGAGYMPVLVC